jgi:alkylhydroperoxidase family enzyme
MPRLPLLRDDEVGPPELVTAIQSRRGGELLDLDRLLLHSPAFTTGWGELMGRVRGALELPPLWREAAICGVAALTDAEFEFFHHSPLYLEAGGTPLQLAAIRHLAEGSALEPVFDPELQAVLQLVIEMTLSVQVSDTTFAATRAVLGTDKRMLELIAVIASYNMVARLLVALNLEP